MATQDECRSLVQREVGECLSYLIQTLGDAYGLTGEPSDFRGPGTHHTERERVRNLEETLEQASLLQAPVDDYESAARDADWIISDGDEPTFVNTADAELETSADPDDGDDAWEALCREHDIEPHQREVFEHWAVTKWFGEKLASYGEKVDFDFCNLVVWARTTTGQAILLDHVIGQIVDAGQALLDNVPLDDYRRKLRKRGIVPVIDKDAGVVLFHRESEPAKEIGRARIKWVEDVATIKGIEIDWLLGEDA
jgi:hypothetical protein